MYFVSYFPPLSFLQMHNMHPRGLRTHSKLYNCVFMGERSQDAGGPYRESWSMYAQELQVLATLACRFVPVARRAPRQPLFSFSHLQVPPLMPPLRCFSLHQSAALLFPAILSNHSSPRLYFSLGPALVQSTALPLLIRTPNGVHAAGVGRDRYVPNPGATSPAQVEMFVFLGKMMGHAMR